MFFKCLNELYWIAYSTEYIVICRGISSAEGLVDDLICESACFYKKAIFLVTNSFEKSRYSF